MKKMYLILIATSVAFSSCDNFDSTNQTGDNSMSANIIVRDYSITAENSYSDLFLDSTAVENYIGTKNINDTAARKIRNFYAVRNYQFAWFTTEGFTEEGLSIYDLYNKNRDNVKNNESTLQRIDSLITQDSLQVSSTDSSYVQTEIALTNTFIQHQDQFVHSGNPNQLYYIIPVKKMDPQQLADSLSKNPIAQTAADSASMGSRKAYNRMQEQLQKYVSILKNGGWQPVPAEVRSAKKGASSPAITLLKKRLQLTGDFIESDTSQVFSDTLQASIKDFQRRYGLKTDGLITDTLITVLNVPAEQRLQQILLNLNRMQWLENKQHENIVVVNIPEYMLHVYEGGNKTFEMPVVVGKEGSNTVMFNSNINQVVFSPYWNIPHSIVRDEIMPAMKKNSNYLSSKNMEIVGNNNESVPKMRQLPGAQNSLGKVKFLFPNRFDIYLHDTPAKDLFQNDKRAFSHGCIRVANAEKLAQYLLKDQPEWTPEKIKQAMNSKSEQQVEVKSPVAVSITYLTAWVDENGKINFREDIYGHDQQTAKRMFSTSALASTPSNQPANDTSRLALP